MKQQLLKVILALPIMLMGLLVNAQVTTKTFKAGIPAGFIEKHKGQIPDIFIKAPAEFEKLLIAGEDPNPNQFSFRYGVAKKETINILDKARTIEKDGYITYLSTVTAEKAVNVSLSFSKFFLPKNAVLKIYSKNQLTDGITETENGTAKKWRTSVYQGNRVNISLRVPVAEKDRAMLEIGKIIFGFRQVGSDISGSVSQDNPFAPMPPPNQSANCNVNVACSFNMGWEFESRSVVLIYDDDGGYFSGSLVMNTCKSNKPYVLTAYHNFFPSGPGQVNPNNCKYVFKYWRLSCDNNGEPNNQTIEIDGNNTEDPNNSAKIVAKHPASDFALVLLPKAPPKTSGVTYSGWNWGGGVPSSVTALHHPLGDVMKISQCLTSSEIWEEPWQGTVPNHWRAKFDHQKGIIQKGSSGGPIYDENRRIVGQIRGIPFGPFGCVNLPQSPNPNEENCGCTTESNAARTSYNGKFSVSWNSGGTPEERLKDWLDPLGLSNGIFVTNTTSIENLQPDPYTAKVEGEASICNLNDSKTYSIDLPPGAFISSWGQSNSSVSVNPISPNSASVTYINTQNTSVTITANVVLTGPCNQGTYPRPKTIALGGASCSTRVAHQLVNGSWVQVGNCIRLTELRSIYQKGKEGKYGNTEYYTTVKVVESYQPIISKGWSYVSSSGSSGYPSFIVTGDNVQVFISNTLPYGWIRLRYTTTTSCGTYSEDYWFTPQPSTTSCPVFNSCLVAARTEEITNVPSEKISLSPNPTSGQFKVLLSTDAKDAVIREVRIKNKMGVAVYRQLFKNLQKEQTINLFNLPTDIYIVEVFDGEKWLTEKLSLQH